MAEGKHDSVGNGSEADRITRLEEELAEMRVQLAAGKGHRDDLAATTKDLRNRLKKAREEGSNPQIIAGLARQLLNKERERRDLHMSIHPENAPKLLVQLGCGTNLWVEQSQNSPDILVRIFEYHKTHEVLKALADMARSLSRPEHGDKKGRNEYLSQVTGKINTWLCLCLTSEEASLVMRVAEVLMRIIDYEKHTMDRNHVNQLNSLLKHIFDGENARAFMELVGTVFPELMGTMMKLIEDHPTLQRTPIRARTVKTFAASGDGAKAKSSTFDERHFVAEGGSCAAGGACAFGLEEDKVESEPFMAGGGACAAGDGVCVALKSRKPKSKQDEKPGKTKNKFVVLGQLGVCPRTVDALFYLNDPLFAHTFSFYRDMATAEHAQQATPGSEILTGAMLKQANVLAHKAYLARQVQPVPAMGQKKMRETRE